jgi:hypothetical protein
MNNPINPSNSLFETTGPLKVIYLDEFKAVLLLRPGCEHRGAFSGGACCTPHSEATGEEGVDDVCTDEAGCAGNEDSFDFHFYYSSSSLESWSSFPTMLAVN